MARATVTVRTLARERGSDPVEVFVCLLDGGIAVRDLDERIPKGRLAEARRLLGLGRTTRAQRDCTVESLVERSGRPEEEVRRRLCRAGLLRKSRQKSVSHAMLRRAEMELGLREIKRPEAQPEPDPVDAGHSASTSLVSPRKKKGEVEGWRTVGPEQTMVYLSEQDLEAVHWAVVRYFATRRDPVDPPGVKSPDLLASSAFRPHTALGDQPKYPTVAMAAATLIHSVVLNHPFHNGNKRTALVAALVLLDKNGWILTANEDEIYGFLLDVADHRLRDKKSGTLVRGSDPEVLAIAMWLQSRIRKVRRQEFPLKFRELREILATYDCSFEHATVGNRVNILREGRRTQVYYGDEGREVPKNTIHKIRADLELDEDHGYDADIFYNKGPRIPEFINRFRKVMSRLARV